MSLGNRLEVNTFFLYQRASIFIAKAFRPLDSRHNNRKWTVTVQSDRMVVEINYPMGWPGEGKGRFRRSRIAMKVKCLLEEVGVHFKKN